MRINCIAKSVLECEVDAMLVGVFKGVALDGPAVELDRALDGLLGKLVEAGEIDGAQSAMTVVHTYGRLSASRVALVGLGDPNSYNAIGQRKAAAAAARYLRDRGCRRLGLGLHLQNPQGVREEQAVRALVEAVHLGLYRGGECKKSPDTQESLDELTIPAVQEMQLEKVTSAAQAGTIVGEEINYARRLVNLPPNEVTPRYLAKEASRSAEELGLEVEIMPPDRIEELGMGALAAVGRGSEEPTQLIVLRYRGSESGPRLAFVGKGLTFDSGGISLKDAEKMEAMKQDMAGGAAALAALRAVARLGLNIDVTAIVPAAENMPSGRAYRPGDVLTAMNKKTIEVISTDAEGRLLLADALAYAVERGATHLVDIATLTGACIIALGHVAAGVMGNDDSYVEAILEAAGNAGERMWRLPLFPEYRAHLESEVADLKNVGGRPAGTIMGGWFLREFVGQQVWAHLDIAGVAYDDDGAAHRVKGATGAGVGTLVALAERLQAIPSL